MIVRLTGGLCNQIFMYAFGRSMSLRRNEPVQFDWRPSPGRDYYALDAYNVKVDLVKKPMQAPFVYIEPGFAFDAKALEQPTGTAFIGYWQSEKYFFKSEIWREELTLQRPMRYAAIRVAEQLRRENSVFIHVRRGDYLNPGTAAYHGNLGHANLQEGYYKDAIAYITEKVNNPKFVIFSDDPTWCQQNMPYPVISAQGFNRCEDLYLMSQCRHAILANSSFSWWGAWLGDYSGRICIAPKKWFNADVDTSTLIPDRWVRL